MLLTVKSLNSLNTLSAACLLVALIVEHKSWDFSVYNRSRGLSSQVSEVITVHLLDLSDKMSHPLWSSALTDPFRSEELPVIWHCLHIAVLWLKCCHSLAQFWTVHGCLVWGAGYLKPKQFLLICGPKIISQGTSGRKGLKEERPPQFKGIAPVLPTHNQSLTETTWQAFAPEFPLMVIQHHEKLSFGLSSMPWWQLVIDSTFLLLSTELFKTKRKSDLLP